MLRQTLGGGLGLRYALDRYFRGGVRGCCTPAPVRRCASSNPTAGSRCFHSHPSYLRRPTARTAQGAVLAVSRLGVVCLHSTTEVVSLKSVNDIAGLEAVTRSVDEGQNASGRIL